MGLGDRIRRQFEHFVNTYRPREADWTYEGQAGLDVQVETPVVNVGAGGSGGAIDVQRKGSNNKQRLYYGGLGGGVGLSLVPSPVSAGFSLMEFPSDGMIYKMPAAGSALSFSEFKGAMLFYSVTGQFGPGAGGVLMFTGANQWIVNALPMTLKAMAVIVGSKAVITFAGMNANIIPGEVGVSAIIGATV